MNTFTNELENVIAGVLKNFEQTDIPLLSATIAKAVQVHFGGEQVYIKKLDKAERDREIVAKFNGKNRKELAKAYGLSNHYIYAIIRNHHLSKQSKL